jgi:hypothetical protein
MDNPMDHQPEDDVRDRPPQQSEASVLAMLKQSNRDIAEGRIVPMAPVLDHMRAVARKIRHERADKVKNDQDPA